MDFNDFRNLRKDIYINVRDIESFNVFVVVILFRYI